MLQDYGGEMRGCHTRTDIESDETIVDIPLQCLITVEMGKATEVTWDISSCSGCWDILTGLAWKSDWQTNYGVQH
jgi:hypothetical protein